MKFEIHKTDNDEFYFRIVAGNGKILAHSETYTRKRNAVEAVAIIKAGAIAAKTVEAV